MGAGYPHILTTGRAVRNTPPVCRGDSAAISGLCRRFSITCSVSRRTSFHLPAVCGRANREPLVSVTPLSPAVLYPSPIQAPALDTPDKSSIGILLPRLSRISPPKRWARRKRPMVHMTIDMPEGALAALRTDPEFRPPVAAGRRREMVRIAASQPRAGRQNLRAFPYRVHRRARAIRRLTVPVHCRGGHGGSWP